MQAYLAAVFSYDSTYTLRQAATFFSGLKSVRDFVQLLFQLRFARWRLKFFHRLNRP